jgi:hypothetical protein
VHQYLQLLLEADLTALTLVLLTVAVARLMAAAAAILEAVGGTGRAMGRKGRFCMGGLAPLLARVTRLLRCMDGLLSCRGRLAAGGPDTGFCCMAIGARLTDGKTQLYNHIQGRHIPHF